jgi:hypothetical protein
MIAFINKWLRRRAVSAPPEEPHIPFHFTGVGLQRADPIVVNHEQWNEIFQRLAAGQLFELRQ